MIHPPHQWPDSEIFEDLFVLELANNHQGSLERGLRIVTSFSRIVRFNNVKAAIKLQLRDVDAFIHKDFRARSDIRYIKRTLDTRLSKTEYATLANAIRRAGCIPMATPFDEVSVELCVELGIDLIKIASSDINDWLLIEKIAATKKPVIVSTGGSSLKDVDDLVKFFNRRQIPLAINHCVSLYPSADHELELNQIDFLRRRYPLNTIGFSTHEHGDWQTSIAIAYAKGARTFERHIDLADSEELSPYCSLPQQIDQWFKAYKRVVAMCGAPGTQKRLPPAREPVVDDRRALHAVLEGLEPVMATEAARLHAAEGHLLGRDDEARIRIADGAVALVLATVALAVGRSGVQAVDSEAARAVSRLRARVRIAGGVVAVVLAEALTSGRDRALARRGAAGAGRGWRCEDVADDGDARAPAGAAGFIESPDLRTATPFDSAAP